MRKLQVIQGQKDTKSAHHKNEMIAKTYKNMGQGSFTMDLNSIYKKKGTSYVAL
jgi:hypothetical protein